MMPPGIGSSGLGMSMSGLGMGGVNQQQHPLFRGYSPSKPKWKGSQPGGNSSTNMMLGNPGSTGFSYNPGNNNANGGGVMLASGFPINTSSSGQVVSRVGPSSQSTGGQNKPSNKAFPY